MILIRHAPALDGGRLAGRRDVAADLGDMDALVHQRRVLGPVSRLITSPAARCIQTAEALHAITALPRPEPEPDLWEQDFGDWEGMRFSDLPDLGPLPPEDLAQHRPPGGESFAEAAARIGPALERLADGPGRIAIVAHAGTVRAALALVVGPAAALGFAVAPLSISILIPAGAGWAIGAVNRVAA